MPAAITRYPDTRIPSDTTIPITAIPRCPDTHCDTCEQEEERLREKGEERLRKEEEERLRKEGEEMMFRAETEAGPCTRF